MGAQASREMEEYRAAYDEWLDTCAAMEAEEIEAQRQLTPSPPLLAIYWLLQLFALVVEVPLRIVYHAVALSVVFTWLRLCTLLTVVLACACEVDAVRIAGCASAAAEATVHQLRMLAHYVGPLPRLLAHNLCVVPRAPVFVWNPDLSLDRPPPPTRPGPVGVCEQLAVSLAKACSCCCATQAGQQLVLRAIRSLLCAFSLHESCHPAACCGPCCAIENLEARRQRWLQDIQQEKNARHERFYQTYRQHKQDRYVFATNTVTGQRAATIVRSGTANEEAHVPCWRPPPDSILLPPVAATEKQSLLV